MRKKICKSSDDDTGKEVFFPLEMVIDHRLGNAGLFGYLQGGGAVESLCGKQTCGSLENFLFLVDSQTGHGAPL